jgi:hypothetical protein
MIACGWSRTMTTTTLTLTPADREAFTRALAMARAESAQMRERLDDELAERGWQAAAETAVYHLQCKTLRLKPWQNPPCWLRSDEDVEDALATPPPDIHGWRFAGKLVQELEVRGLSRYEPSPLEAIARADKTAAGKKGQGDGATAGAGARTTAGG